MNVTSIFYNTGKYVPGLRREELER